MPTKSIHIRLPMPHVRLLHKLAQMMGLDHTAIIKLALYELAVKHGLKLEHHREDKT